MTQPVPLQLAGVTLVTGRALASFYLLAGITLSLIRMGQVLKIEGTGLEPSQLL
jgi:hypothetical protein